MALDLTPQQLATLQSLHGRHLTRMAAVREQCQALHAQQQQEQASQSKVQQLSDQFDFEVRSACTRACTPEPTNEVSTCGSCRATHPHSGLACRRRPWPMELLMRCCSTLATAPSCCSRCKLLVRSSSVRPGLLTSYRLSLAPQVGVISAGSCCMHMCDMELWLMPSR